VSWHYLQGQEAACWEGFSLAGAPSALSRLIPTADPCFSPGSETAPSRSSQSGTTSAPSTGNPGAGTLTSSPEASPARTSATPAGHEQDSTGQEAGSGSRCSESSARCSPPSFSLRTAQLCVFEASTEFSPALPSWGTMRRGAVSERKRPADLARGGGCGSWPRPTASMSTHGWGQTRQRQGNRYGKQVRENVKREKEAQGWRPRVNLLEWILGWPIGWSGLEPLVTGRTRDWLLSLGEP